MIFANEPLRASLICSLTNHLDRAKMAEDGFIVINSFQLLFYNNMKG